MARNQVLIACRLRSMVHKIVCFVVCSLGSQPVLASYDLSFKDLATKDYTAMLKLVRAKMGPDVIDDNEREPNVRSALRIVLSRRNTDGKRTALFNHLQVQLPDVYFSLSIQKVEEEAVSILKGSESDTQKATALVVLENLMAELRPKLNDNRVLFESIREAKIDMSESLKTVAKLEGMSENVSPSLLAKRLLDATPAPKNDSSSSMAKNIIDSWD